MNRGQIFLLLEGLHRPIVESLIDEHVPLPRLLIFHGDRAAGMIAEGLPLIFGQFWRHGEIIILKPHAAARNRWFAASARKKSCPSSDSHFRACERWRIKYT